MVGLRGPKARQTLPELKMDQQNKKLNPNQSAPLQNRDSLMPQQMETVDHEIDHAMTQGDKQAAQKRPKS